MITKKQIKEALQKIADKEDSSIGGIVGYDLGNETVDGLTFTEEDSVGGEGEGDYRHEVFLVTNETKDSVYIKFEGSYTSYEGSEFDGDFQIVEPYMKEVRDWKSVK